MPAYGSIWVLVVPRGLQNRCGGLGTSQVGSIPTYSRQKDCCKKQVLQQSFRYKSLWDFRYPSGDGRDMLCIRYVLRHEKGFIAYRAGATGISKLLQAVISSLLCKHIGMISNQGVLLTHFTTHLFHLFVGLILTNRYSFTKIVILT